jgi:hypothetical protein
MLIKDDEPPGPVDVRLLNDVTKPGVVLAFEGVAPLAFPQFVRGASGLPASMRLVEVVTCSAANAAMSVFRVSRR